jgi:NTP pyrophosphatase (non-canonical NTP hydrolase)
MTTELPEFIQDFNSALLSLDAKLSENKDSWSVEETGEILLQLNRFKDDLKSIYGNIEKLLADLMGQVPEIQLTDGSRIEKNSAPSRKGWKHKELATEVASRLKDMSIDMDTGEIVLTPEDMIVKMLDYVYPSYWKVKELGKIGINADKYSEVGEVKDSIIVRKAK